MNDQFYSEKEWGDILFKKEMDIRKENDKNILKELNEADLIINSTPIGLENLKIKTNNLINKEMPLGTTIWQEIDTNKTIYDLVYNPRPTKWIQMGNQKGWQCIDGLEMLIEQGAESLRIWSGQKVIPVDVMREAALSALST